MNIFARIKARYRWTWVGTVLGETNVKRGDSLIQRNTYWNLYERGDGKRKYVEVGDTRRYFESSLCAFVHGQVQVWKAGGPMPALLKSPEVPKNSVKLIVFNGGRGST
jgi:hypothetical protein